MAGRDQVMVHVLIRPADVAADTRPARLCRRVAQTGHLVTSHFSLCQSERVCATSQLPALVWHDSQPTPNSRSCLANGSSFGKLGRQRVGVAGQAASILMRDGVQMFSDILGAFVEKHAVGVGMRIARPLDVFVLQAFVRFHAGLDAAVTAAARAGRRADQLRFADRLRRLPGFVRRVCRRPHRRMEQVRGNDGAGDRQKKNAFPPPSFARGHDNSPIKTGFQWLYKYSDAKDNATIRGEELSSRANNR